MPTGAEWLDAPVRITRDAVYFGDEKAPGLIAQDGITFKPGGETDINQLSITFLVGHVTADDPYVTSSDVTVPAETVTQYQSRGASDE